MIKAIVVDDELSAIKSLKWEIEQFCSDVVVVETYTSPAEAILGIEQHKPDCVFLDIEMPEIDGFQLLEQVQFNEFDLIITTAYDSYALKAFKESAIGYLLKPVDSDDLVAAISKVTENKTKNALGAKLISLLEAKNKSGFNKIALPLSGKTIFVKHADILYCKSDGNYTEVFFLALKKEMLSKKLKDVEAIINNDFFLRVHNSFLVNINYIKEYRKGEALIVLENDTTIPVARSKKEDLLKMLLSS